MEFGQVGYNKHDHFEQNIICMVINTNKKTLRDKNKKKEKKGEERKRRRQYKSVHNTAGLEKYSYSLYTTFVSGQSAHLV
jgi:hypothetical protein